MNLANNKHQLSGLLVNGLQKRLLLFLLMANLFSVFMVFSGLSPFTDRVAAWCEPNATIFNNSETFTEECKLGNLSEIEKLPAGRVLTNSEYDSKIEQCRNGDAGGWDNSPSELHYSDDERRARCANAIVSCQKYAIDVADCTPNNVKTMSGSECNSGRLSGNGNDDCQRLKEMNGAHIDEIKESVCGGEADNAAGAQATNDCKAAVSSQCLQNVLNDDGTVKGNSFDDAQKCAVRESRELAKSPEVCESRGGIWIDKQYDDPTGGNSDVSAGCKNQGTDLINEEACKAGAASSGKRLVWKQTGGLDTSKPQDDDFGCVDLDNPDGEDNDNPDDPTAGPGGKTPTGSTKQCGSNAKVNLLECGSEGGGTALGNVLRIFVIVLSFGVGVAAVGGLAWSAIQYASASDNQGNVSAARERIRNIVIGLFLFGFLIAITNWLVPGGVL